VEIAASAGPLRFVVMELRGSDAPGSGDGSLTRICGLPVLVRNLLLLQRNGYGKAWLMVDAGQRLALERALALRPLAMQVEIVEGAGAEARVFSALSDGIGLYWPGSLSFGRHVPALVSATPAPGELLAARHGSDAPGLFVFRGPLATPDGAHFTTLVESYRTTERLGIIEIALAPQFVRSRADARRAERELLVSLRKGADGVVAKFDRYISLAISRQLMKLPVTPNMATLAAGGLAILAALLASRGDYWPMLGGALLFQMNSIFDGIDGEIARAKLLESRLGQWLDTIVDDVSNCAFAVGAALGVFRNTGSELFLVLGALAAAGFVAAAAFMYHYLITVAHSGDLNDFRMPWDAARGDEPARSENPSPPQGLFARLFSAVRFLGRRDAFTFMSTVLACFGRMDIMVWLFAIGAVYLAASIAIGHLGIALQRPRRAS
jgi:phosphatidylglycerophosphate synthase